MVRKRPMKIALLILLLINCGLGFIYYSAGLSKLAPYEIGNFIGPVDLGAQLQSELIKMMMLLVAVYQFVVGFLILSIRYALIGQIMLLPISFGILIFTIVAGFELTPMINGFLLLCNILILLSERKAIRGILKRDKTFLHESYFFNSINQSNLHLKITLAVNFILFLACLLYPAIAIYPLMTTFILFYAQICFFRGLSLIDKIVLFGFYLFCFHILGGIWLINNLSKQLFLYSLALSALLFVITFISKFALIILYKLGGKPNIN